MEDDEEPPSNRPQCPVGPAVVYIGRRNVEARSDKHSNETVELTVRVKASEPKMLIEVSSCLCEDGEACECENGLFDSPSSLCLSPRTAAAQTHMPSTKPKARTLVACRQLIDGSEAASLRDQSPRLSLTIRGTVASVSPDPSRTSSAHASITENKSQSDRELCLQVEERKQQTEQERSRNTVKEQKHNDTVQHLIWGMPGSGAPNYHLGTAKRTRNLSSAGILPQEQIRDTGFSGIPFQRP